MSSFLRTVDYICNASMKQEFSIEIPDAEADEIKTVQQGLLFFLNDSSDATKVSCPL